MEGNQGKGRRNTLIFNALLVVLLVAFFVLVYSRANAEDIPLKDLGETLQTETELGVLEPGDERDLMHFIGLASSQYDEMIYFRSQEALGVEELLVVKVADKDTLGDIQTKVEQRVDTQIKAFEGYGPEQVRLLQNAVITKRGNYLFYCVAEDPDPYEEVFRNAI